MNIATVIYAHNRTDDSQAMSDDDLCDQTSCLQLSDSELEEKAEKETEKDTKSPHITDTDVEPAADPEDEASEAASDTSSEADPIGDAVDQLLDDVEGQKNRREFIRRCEEALLEHIDEFPYEQDKIRFKKAFTFTHTEDGRFKLNKTYARELMDEFDEMRYAKINNYNKGRYSPTIRPSTLCVYKKLKHLVAAICEVCDCEGDVAYPILTLEQMTCVLFWFSKYMPRRCYEVLKEIDVSRKTIHAYWMSMLNYYRIARIAKHFDLDKMLKKEAEPNDDSDSDDDADDNEMGHVYLCHLGIYFINGKAWHYMKGGESHDNKHGVIGRLNNHFINPNFLDVTILDVIECESSMKLEKFMKKKIGDAKVAKASWHHTPKKKEVEVFRMLMEESISDLLSHIKMRADRLNVSIKLHSKEEQFNGFIVFTDALGQVDREMDTAVDAADIGKVRELREKRDKIKALMHTQMSS